MRLNAYEETPFFSNGLNLTYQTDWMASIPDSKLLSDLSIPGTHDSGTGVGPLTHDVDFVHTQAFSVAEQLAGGIRFLDIRLKRRGGESQNARDPAGNYLKVFHGSTDIGISFGDVLDDCLNFLTAHPTETIVMSVKNEDDPKAQDEQKHFANTFKQYVDTSTSYWYTDGHIPQLGALGSGTSVRGKIVLVARASGIQGIDYGNSAIFDKQDDYLWNNPVFARSRKFGVVSDQLKAAKASDRADLWFINFTSATGFAGSPVYFADDVNESVYDWFETKHGRYGTIIMDFPGSGLIERIINSNSPTVLREGNFALGIERFGFHAQPTLIRVGFSGPLDAASAANLESFRLTQLRRDGRSRSIAIEGVTYEAATQSIMLRPERRLRLWGATYRLVVDGTSENGVKDTDGALIDGDDDGISSGDLDRVFGPEILAGRSRAVSQRRASPTREKFGISAREYRGRALLRSSHHWGRA